jgi:serine/threonine-protein kinase RsbW
MSGRHAESDRAPDDSPSGELLHVVPAEPGSLRPVRAAMAEWLKLLHWPDDDAEDLVLAVSEAVTNVIEHAYPTARPGPVGLRARCSAGSAPGTRRVTVSITDRGGWDGERRVIDPAGRRGHGLTVMSACTARTQIRHSADGTTVTLTSKDVPRS